MAKDIDRIMNRVYRFNLDHSGVAMGGLTDAGIEVEALLKRTVMQELQRVKDMVDQYVLRVEVGDIGKDPTLAVDRAELYTNVISSRLASHINANIQDRINEVMDL